MDQNLLGDAPGVYYCTEKNEANKCLIILLMNLQLEQGMEDAAPLCLMWYQLGLIATFGGLGDIAGESVLVSAGSSVRAGSPGLLYRAPALPHHRTMRVLPRSLAEALL